MAGPAGIRVPQGLDDPPRFLIWSADLVFVALTVLFIGALLECTVLGALTGLVCAFVWHRITAARGRHYGLALAYWHLNISPVRRLWPSSCRRFIG